MKTLYTYIYTILLTVCTGIGSAFAQTATVTGKLLDEKQQPLPFATVGLLRAKDSSVVKGNMSNDNGGYSFTNVAPGNYIIRATSVGYKNGISPTFTISSADHNVATITLQPAAQTLKAVNINSARPLIERKIDRTVMNVENSVLAAGNTALEILERAPGVTIDKDDNISLKGKQGVTVMINDKLTYLSAQQLATLLRSTDGNTIQSIEIITNPSAKYAAAGNSGIINIKTKKNKASGTSGSLSASAMKGRYFRDNTALNLNHKQGALNVFGNFSRGDNKRYRDFAIDRIIKGNAGDLTYFRQKSDQVFANHYNNFRVGADLETGKNNTIGVVVGGYSNSGRDYNFNTTLIGKTVSAVDSSLTTESNMNQTYRNIAVNLNDRLKLDTLGQELSIDLDYSKFNNNSIASYDSYYYLPGGASQRAPQLLRNQTPSVIEIYTGKFDYTKPFSKTIKMELGAKFSSVKTDNDLQAEIFSGGNYINDVNRTNRFIYTERVNAGYANLSKEYKNGSVQVGLRAEETTSNGNLIGSKPVDRKYLNFFPSVFINQKLDKKNELGFNYSRRIDRPSYGNLNPFVYYLDPYTASRGNAFLNPQYTNSFSLHYTYNKTIDVSLDYNHTTDAMTEIVLTEGNISYQTNLNLQTQIGYGLNVYSPYNITKWWTGNINFNGFRMSFKGDNLIGGNLRSAQTAFVAKSSQYITLGLFRAELTGVYQSPMTFGVFNIHERYWVDAGVSRSFANKKFNVKLALDDIFYTRRNNSSSNVLNNNFEVRQAGDTRVVRLNVTYNFGNAKIKASQRRSGADDEKNRVGGGN